MKRQKSLVIFFGIISLLGMVIIVQYNRYDHETAQVKCKTKFASADGTNEDPLAHARFHWHRIRNPISNDIPENIGTKEIAFVNKLAAQARKTHQPIMDNWVSRGPYHIGGRTKALALDILDENTILAGCVSSGMFKSTDGGSTWIKTTAPEQLHSVSCIAQTKASGREHIWYYGTGVSPRWGGGSASGLGNNDDVYRGDGIFQSTDNGNTWSQLESTVSGTADKTDPFDFIYDIVTFGDSGLYAATSSGLFKSTDGGNSWTHELDFGQNYLSTEIALTSQGVCYATIGGDGPDNGIYQCTDGKTWLDISPLDWPDTTIRTVMSIAPSNEDIVYFFSAEAFWKQQLRKYEDGVGWTDLTQGLPENGEMTTYGGNMLIVYVKPDDDKTIFLGTVALFRSTNGGQSYELIGAQSDFHVDQHAIVFYPSDPDAMIVGNDGGLFKTTDNLADPEYDSIHGGYHIPWESLNNGYLTTQFYTVSLDHGTQGSDLISGGMQDNGCMYTTSANPLDRWDEILGGDGGFTAITSGGEYHYTAMAASLNVYRHSWPNGEHQRTEITPASSVGMGLWLQIFVLDPFDEKIMYLPTQRELWRNEDLTQIPHVYPRVPTDSNWTKFANVNDHYITAMGMSGAEPRRLYYGSALGKIFYLDNPHESQPVPVDVTGDQLPFACPQGGWVNCIAVDPRDANKVMVAFSMYDLISIFASENGGETWTPVSGNLEENPDGSGSGPSVRWISILYVEDKPVYFAGTSAGLFSTITLDGMNTVWVQEGRETIGNVVVDMIDVRQSDGFVVVGTHGNGVYSSYLSKWPEGLGNTPKHIDRVKLYPAYPNPFIQSTSIRFFLPEPGPVRLKVYDMQGKEVDILMDRYCQRGENTVHWEADGLPGGTYFIRFSFQNFDETQKVLLLE
jgi:photosystem II stability/assembly factor-like uncharacterized protein